MRFELTSFRGIRPAVSPDLLSNGEAVLAVNTRLSDGTLVPYNRLGPLSPPVDISATAKSLYRFGQTLSSETQYWFQSDLDCDFVRGPVIGDTTERTYWTDGVYPKKTDAALATSSAPYPAASYRMGLPAPADAVMLAVTGTPTNASDPAETVIYRLTYVSAWGEEGPPGPVSLSVDIRPGQSVEVTAMPTAPAGAYNITGKRLYRSATGNSSTAFQLVNTEADIPVASTAYTDTKLTAALGETLATTGWVEPPDNMVGLAEMPNGILAGFYGNTLCFSEPNAPYAWPVRYRKSFDAPIVGIKAFDQSLFVGTTAGVHVVTGVDSASMTPERLPFTLSLASKRSMVRMMGGVVFAAPTGLYLVSSSGIISLSHSYFQTLDWKKYNPSSFHSYEHDNKYIAFFSGADAGSGALILSFGDNPNVGTTDVYATAGYRDPRTTTLFLLVDGELQKWDAGGAQMSQSWESGVFNAPFPTSMSCARLLADSYPVVVQVTVDGASFVVSAADKYPFRLPAGYVGRRFVVRLSGAPVMREFVMATSMAKLGRGDPRG